MTTSLFLKIMSAVTSHNEVPAHTLISNLHCICNVIANFFGYEFHVSVKLDTSKKYKIEIVELDLDEPSMIEHIVIPDDDLVVANNDVSSEITL